MREPQQHPRRRLRPRFLEVHPLLRPVENGDLDRHASWLELFFDLMFVLVVTQVAHVLSVDMTWTGFGHFAALAVPFWWSWVGYTFYASRFEVDRDIVYRVLMLFGMLAIAALAISVPGAFKGGEVAFILSYLAVRVVLVVMYVRAYIYVHLARELSLRYLTGFSIGVLLWLGGLLTSDATRYTLCALGLAVELITPLVSFRVARRTPYDTRHIPERFGLFTIIVLGEVLVSVVSGITDTHWHPYSFFTAVCCFGICASFWWIYFDFVETRPIRRWGMAGQIYIYAHLLLMIAIAMVGVGTRHAIIEAASGVLSDPVRLVLSGGVALYLIAVIVIRIVARSHILLWVRVVSTAVAIGLALFGSGASAPVVTAALFLAMIADICVETVRTWGEWKIETISDLDPIREGAPPPTTAPSLRELEHPADAVRCTHLDQIVVTTSDIHVCEECRKLGDTWVELRLCLVCGYVGCCETSKNQHALKHFDETGHPIIQTMQPGQNWRWCYIDETYLEGS